MIRGKILVDSMEFKGQAINRPSMFKGEKYET